MWDEGTAWSLTFGRRPRPARRHTGIDAGTPRRERHPRSRSVCGDAISGRSRQHGDRIVVAILLVSVRLVAGRMNRRLKPRKS